MKINRKNFLKLSGLAGTGMLFGTSQAKSSPFHKSHVQKFNMHGYAAPKLETVRMGFIGIGARGSGNVSRYSKIEGVEVKALCDTVPGRVTAAIDLLKKTKTPHKPDAYSGGPEDWKKVCDRKDIDLVCIGTPWHLHAQIAVYAMERDKHVYVDIPVGVTVEECWQVVETSERTRKHVYMACMNCLDGFAPVLNMARQGFFGDLIHGEGHYIHDRVSQDNRWIRDPDNNNYTGYRPWRLQENVNRNGNLYPQHGVGPLAQIMDLNYGDQMKYMVSISSNDFTMSNKMRELAETDDFYKPYVGLKFRGNMNSTIIRTYKGRTLMLQHDISSPRPGHRFELISGNKGIYRAPSNIATSEEGWLSKEEYNALITKYTPEVTKRFNERRKGASPRVPGVSYSGVYASDWRFIDCIRNGLPIDIDVYDAALWSVITPLSEWSVAREGATVEVPDFTGGAWKTNTPGIDLTLERGGGTTRML